MPTAALSDSDEPDSDASSTGRHGGPSPRRAEASTQVQSIEPPTQPQSPMPEKPWYPTHSAPSGAQHHPAQRSKHLWARLSSLKPDPETSLLRASRWPEHDVASLPTQARQHCLRPTRKFGDSDTGPFIGMRILQVTGLIDTRLNLPPMKTLPPQAPGRPLGVQGARNSVGRGVPA